MLGDPERVYLSQRQLIKYCNNLGIWTQSGFMIGFPFETREDIMQTIDYAVDCGVDVACYRMAVPYPGSEMYHVFKENGLLPDDVENGSKCRAPVIFPKAPVSFDRIRSLPN